MSIAAGPKRIALIRGMALGLMGLGAIALLPAGFAAAADSEAAEKPQPPLPGRIVSFVPHATEMLFAIGEGGRLVGVGDTCLWPEEAAKLPKLGGAFDARADDVAALNPGLVFVSPSHILLRAELAKRGIRVHTVQTNSINDALWLLYGLGKDAGILDTVTPMGLRLAEELDSLYKEGNKRPSRRVLMCVGHSSDSLERLFVISKDNYLDELIRSAGAENAAIVSKDEYGRASQGLVVEMTRQQAIDAKPEVVIDLLPDREPTAVERQKTEAMWRGLFAAQPSAPRRIYVLYDPYLGVPGMRIPDSLRKMGRWIYPEI